MIPPPCYKARKAGYEDLDFTVKSKFCCYFNYVDSKSTFLEPIEQNVHGNKGVYELVYFVKESKSLERFKKQATDFDKLIEGKSPEELERLVSFS